MKAIIFGITGQDGSYLAELLLNKGYEVIGITRRVSVPTLIRINHILPKIKIIEGDITDAFSVSNVVKEEQPDEIYNLAAQSHVGTSFKQPSLTWDVTAGGVLNILEAIRYSGRKEDIKFYQASSSEMFGKNYNLLEGLAEMIKYQDENTPFMPQSPYAIAKLAAHHLVRNYRDSYGIFACSGILFPSHDPSPLFEFTNPFCNFSSNKLFSPSFAFVIEQNTTTSKYSIAITILANKVMCC